MNIYFDFDGTLSDVSSRHYETYVQGLAYVQGTPLNKHNYWNMKRNKVKWADILTESNVDPELESEFLGHFIDIIEQPAMLKDDTLFSSAQEILQSLSNNNTLVLVSLRRSHQNLLEQLDHLNIRPYFQTILSGHSETITGTLTKKAEVISQLGLTGSSMIVGDTEADISAAKQLSIISVAVTSGIRTSEYLRSLGPDFVIDSIGELTGIVDKISSDASR